MILLVSIFACISIQSSRTLVEGLFRQTQTKIVHDTHTHDQSFPIPSKRHGLIWFLHFHKAAGTSFTNLAWKNDERLRHSMHYEVASNDEHGHLELDSERQLRWDDLVWPNRPSKTSCSFDPSTVEKQQARLLRKEFESLRQHDISFTSTEHWFPPLNILKNLPNQTLFVVLMREPMERLVSSYNFHKRGKNRCPKPRERCKFRDWFPAESNVHVKMLNGIPFGPLKVKECAREMFVRNVTIQDYENALESLRQFHVVITLESVKKTPEKTACVLQKMLGWKKTTLPLRNTMRNQRHSLSITAEEIEEARRDNKWDLLLYERTREMEQELFEKLRCT